MKKILPIEIFLLAVIGSIEGRKILWIITSEMISYMKNLKMQNPAMNTGLTYFLLKAIPKRKILKIILQTDSMCFIPENGTQGLLRDQVPFDAIPL